MEGKNGKSELIKTSHSLTMLAGRKMYPSILDNNNPYKLCKSFVILTTHPHTHTCTFSLF